MIRLCARALFADDRTSLERIGEQVGALHLAKSARIREIGSEILDYSIHLTRLENAGIASDIFCDESQPSFLNIVWFSFLLPMTASNAPNDPWRLKAVVTCSLHSFPFSGFFRSRLCWFGTPPQVCDPIIIGIYSLAQFVTSRLALELPVTNPLDLIGSALVLSSFHASHSFLVHTISKYLPFIPDQVIGLAVSYSTSEIMHEFIRFGFEAGVYRLFDGVLSFCKLFQTDLGEPPNIAIPHCLTCNICHDLLVDPVESLGFFFCRSCLNEWFTSSGSWIHPVTGEQIRPSTVSRPGVLNIVTRKYHKMVLRQS
jgi:hypothetical protein